MKRGPSRRCLLVAGAAMAFGGRASTAYSQNATDPLQAVNVRQAVNDSVARYFNAYTSTAVTIVRDGVVLASAGDVTRKVNVRSVRKSLLSTMYGAVQQEFRIDLDATLASFNIDDAPPLTATERGATLRMLLQARSGIFHEAAYETADMRKKRPPRGSHAPGSFWYYNNWDFNALGTLYTKITGEKIFDGFYRRIAKPIGMQDFQPSDGELVYEKVSRHPAYPFHLSARDAAVFGQLILARGAWNGQQIVPAAWIDEASQPFSQTDRPGRGYGYLWWILPVATFGKGAILASGFGGQLIAIIPQARMVAVQAAAGGHLRTGDFLNFVKELHQA